MDAIKCKMISHAATILFVRYQYSTSGLIEDSVIRSILCMVICVVTFDSHITVVVSACYKMSHNLFKEGL